MLESFVGNLESGQEKKIATLTSKMASMDDNTSDRKSTRLNSSHGYTPYAGFHLKKQKMIPSSTQGMRQRSGEASLAETDEVLA